MDIVSYNPGHDGAIAHLRHGHLVSSIEAEKDSNYRYTPIAAHDLVAAFGQLEEVPDVMCTGGWWPREARPTGAPLHVGYRGITKDDITVEYRQFLGKTIPFFSSSHERSHLLCGYGMSPFPQGEPCYVLVWEGTIGAFYEIDSNLDITLISDVMNEPGDRYSSVYGLADPTFPKDAQFSRFSDAGKLMALASFSQRKKPTSEEEELMNFLLTTDHVQLNLYKKLTSSPYYNVGTDDVEFRNFTGIFSDRIFDTFYRFARENMRKGLPLIIVGGCGLNCDWNTKWRESGLFSDVFVPPVANDSGSAIGTAIDAQYHFTGNAKVEWNVYTGLPFKTDSTVASDRYDVRDVTSDEVAGMLSGGLILGWVRGKYEIGPRALGNRSILAAPFEAATRVRLNEIKQREQFRPIAPVSLEADAVQYFGCDRQSPHMLFTYQATTDALPAVTHANGTARLQTVSPKTNSDLYDLLTAFKSRTGYGVLCNTSLNYNGKGFINNFADLDNYTVEHKLDGFIVDGRAYLLRSSEHYNAYLAGANS
ncbi:MULTISPECIES: carbamoyltransferase C-terminal domain-containing protein [Rhodococcus]|uniref:Carbamoyltransferase C-terminal domain-containing protein n=1 Tax=Rhodococcus qingshengii TaxID=334542 RepID=A0AAW6LLB9_RHOSG|nr:MULTISPECIES: carbamoyltransferase C-terminal domain-containing protein [Rhodococcus]MCZ4545136.1 3-hydroxymethylcephem carbamoyltransferase [Rhodococcus qingshengii]MDE8644870.1 carbamoyltransferase C-terminal domain-containing protein [Rhodococcus qingshengii]OKA15489.1 proline dehydrogenase [Rhodococcus erythropolis]